MSTTPSYAQAAIQGRPATESTSTDSALDTEVTATSSVWVWAAYFTPTSPRTNKCPSVKSSE
eukprot:CAMPEP_0204196928 /NCGR_PEP_ID=MMETSP0361-20130328/64185_1 /ASSEMBLY_ACC=CAM_ASM_000343 /TAXON_ID=268821 /ORGANISM="Scrippsiella Hangoei, Strain SHTV-5" /LENGTH=61 /DNA_ID=CAMNT_0051158765 /DNA_START=6 /DNA_END=188 /DNA_ORIENTATION=+